MAEDSNRSPRVGGLLLRRFLWRHWRGGWPSYLSLVAIVAVGVGAFLGIRQASRAATANFGLFNEAVSGRSDFLIEAPVGPLADADLERLGELAADPDWHLLPVVEGSVTALDAAGESQRQLRLVGLDLVALGNLPTVRERDFEILGEDGWRRWLGRSGVVWATRPLARELGLEVGSRLEVVSAGEVLGLEVAGLLGEEGDELPADLLVGDLPAVREALGRGGEIDRVEVLLADRERRVEREVVAAVERRLRAALPEGLELRPAAERAERRASMTEAFRLNLTILSSIALLVGAYLILQALDAAVVRRRAELATLRSLGVGSRALFGVCLAEALAIGLLGSLAGVGVGMLLAGGAVGMLTDTVEALYYETAAEAIRLRPADWALGLGLGLGFSLVAGLLPARDAMQTPPAQVLSRGDWSPGFGWLRRPWVGLGLLGLGAGALALPPWSLASGGKLPVGGFVAAGFAVLGVALLSGQCLVGLAALARPLARGAVGRIAVSRLADGSSRHRLAVAGLVVAVGMVTGMLVMVGGFRETIVRWFDVRFQADLYVSERGATGAAALEGIAPELIERLERDPAVEFADTLHVGTVRGPVGPTRLAGADLEAWQGRVEQIWLRAPGELELAEGVEPALVSEPFARRFGVLDGGAVSLRTPAGRREIGVLGVFADYGNEFGTAVVSRERWSEWMGSERALNSSLFLKPGEDRAAVRERLRLEFPGLEVRDQRELRALVLAIFEETFRVTHGLNGIGLSVALAGLVLGLVAIFDESATTWRTLRRLGFSRGRMRRAAALEGAGIALAAWVAGGVLGLAVGWVLIAVINVQSFGWTLVTRWPLAEMLGFGVLLGLLGALCGVAAAAWWRHREERS